MRYSEECKQTANTLEQPENENKSKTGRRKKYGTTEHTGASATEMDPHCEITAAVPLLAILVCRSTNELRRSGNHYEHLMMEFKTQELKLGTERNERTAKDDEMKNTF
uniref:Uncharacterized protein n=1 Tax=Angiostrongylus cantonensis TaxID=6313 RepID=A0A0K0D556_ANGCA